MHYCSRIASQTYIRGTAGFCASGHESLRISSSWRASRRAQLSTGIRCQAQIEVDMRVDGMTCKHCTAAVAKALEDSPEVVEVRNVDLQHGIASVYVEADSQSEAVSKVSGLCETIEKIGFKAAPHSGSDGGLDQTS